MKIMAIFSKGENASQAIVPIWNETTGQVNIPKVSDNFKVYLCYFIKGSNNIS